MMPFVGIHSYQQAEAANTDPGLRIGSVMGGRLSDLFSLNGEVHADLTNPGDLPAGTKISELTFSGCFSPLVQIHDENIEFVLGPKIGGFLVQQRISNGLGNSAADGLGLLIGLNFGMFYPVSPATSVGVLLSLELAKLTTVCADSVCDMNVDAPASEILGLTAAALF